MGETALGGCGAGNSGPTPVVIRLDDGERGRWFLSAETISPLYHPAHITLRHGAMVMTAATIVVTHPFEVVAQKEVASFICLRHTYANVGYCVDGAADAETWGHLEVGGRPWVMRLGGGLGLPVVPSLWAYGWSRRGVEA